MLTTITTRKGTLLSSEIKPINKLGQQNHATAQQPSANHKSPSQCLSTKPKSMPQRCQRPSNEGEYAKPEQQIRSASYPQTRVVTRQLSINHSASCAIGPVAAVNRSSACSVSEPPSASELPETVVVAIMALLSSSSCADGSGLSSSR